MNIKYAKGLLAVVGCIMCGCAKNNYVPNAESPVQVGFFMGSPATKTAVSEDNLSVEWNVGDKVSLWASTPGGELVLNNQVFNVLGSYQEAALFTSELDEAMEKGSYLYAACYPTPSSGMDSYVSFTLPAEQNGKIANYDFMVSDVVEGSELKEINYTEEDYSSLGMNMKHIFHMLRVYIPEEYTELSDGVSEFYITASKPIAGTVGMDLLNPGRITVKDQVNQIHVKLDEPLMPSGKDNRQYAYVMILPFEASEDDFISLEMDVYNTKGDFPVYNISGRNFNAGHASSAALYVANPEFRDFASELVDNLLGEDILKLRFVGPEGLVWLESNSNVVEVESGEEVFPFDQSFAKAYKINRKIYESGEFEVVVEMESEHFISRQTITVEDIDEFHVKSVVYAPELLVQDFSEVESFSSNDGTNATSGSKAGVSFLDGWSGARIGAEESTAIRIASRYDVARSLLSTTRTASPARVDSAPLPEVIKDVDIELSFNYNTSFEPSNSGSASLFHGHTVSVGYTTTAGVIASGTTTIQGAQNTTINTQDDGAYDNITKEMTLVMHLTPGPVHRFTWRSTPVTNNSDAATKGATYYLYLDNIVAKIKQE